MAGKAQVAAVWEIRCTGAGEYNWPRTSRMDKPNDPGETLPILREKETTFLSLIDAVIWDVQFGDILEDMELSGRFTVCRDDEDWLVSIIGGKRATFTAL